MSANFNDIINRQIHNTIKDTGFDIGNKYKGKVRDVYDLDDKLLIIATDRISAFDKVLSVVPFKGEILTNLSMFWFEKTSDIIKNHIIRQIHPNAVLVKKCSILPVEVIIRGYLTGGGWREYAKTGYVSGIKLPADLKKDSKFDNPIFTPTTKAAVGHDESISKEEIIKRGIVSEAVINKIEDYAFKLFERGAKLAAENNLILVDTKYEFGQLEDGTIILADEIHTSDSSRYWYKDTYEKLYNESKEQRALDKEYFRQWLLDNNYQGDGLPPDIPINVIQEICRKYIAAYETITGVKYKLEVKNSAGSLENAVNKLKSGL